MRISKLTSCRQDNRGFTLMETLVVIGIIAILAAAIAPLFFTQISERRVDTTSAELDTLADAIRRFYRDTGRMPPTLEALVSLTQPYDDDFDDTVDEDDFGCSTPCDPPGISADDDDDGLVDEDPLGCTAPCDPPGYTGWRGPYLQGGPSVSTNPAFSDSWNTAYAYCFIETGMDVNGNDAQDLICVSPTPRIDSSRRMDSWKVESGVHMCPDQVANAVIVSYGRDRGLNGAMDGNPDPLVAGPALFDDDDTHTYYNLGTAADAYDSNGFLRLVFNDDDGDCLLHGVDEDDYDGVDNDGDGETDEDPAMGSAGHSGDFVRLVSVATLAQDKTEVTSNRLDDLADAIRRFYADTTIMPPSLEALVINTPYDDDGDGTDDEDPVDGADNDTDTRIDEDPAGIIDWAGPYAGGTLPVATNPDFIDGWDRLIEYHGVPDPALDLEFNLAVRNGLYQAILLSLGANQTLDSTGDGSAIDPLVISDDDGDGAEDEDPVDGLDNDGDTLFDEDPVNTDASAPDLFRLISIRGIEAEKITATRRVLQLLNEAALRFNSAFEITYGASGAGYCELDSLEYTSSPASPPHPCIDPIAGGLFNQAIENLISLGYIGSSYHFDAWGNRIRWRIGNPADLLTLPWQFYSTGPNGVDDSTVQTNPPSGDDIFQ